MKRAKNWPELLSAFVRERRNIPFSWGYQDCCLFAADAVHIMTGEDLAAEFRGTYTDAISATRILKEHGGLESIVDSKLESVPVTFASRGSVVVIERVHGLALGIVMAEFALVPDVNGLNPFPLLGASRAWKV